MSKITEAPKRYRCVNATCTLGTRGVPGHFTGGISAAQVTVLTGKPAEYLEPNEHGEGVCPNCGEPGEPDEQET